MNGESVTWLRNHCLDPSVLVVGLHDLLGIPGDVLLSSLFSPCPPNMEVIPNGVIIQRVACELQTLGPNLKQHIVQYNLVIYSCSVNITNLMPSRPCRRPRTLTRFSRKARMSPTNLGAGFEGPFPVDTFDYLHECKPNRPFLLVLFQCKVLFHRHD